MHINIHISIETDNTSIEQDYFNDNLVNEMTVIKPVDTYNAVKENYGIEVDGDGSSDRNFIYDPYFKIYLGHDANHSTKVTRISILRPEYIVHNNEEWILTSQEKKHLMTLLNYKFSKTNKTVWDTIIYACIAESKTLYKMDSFSREEIIKKLKALEIPDYTELPSKKGK